MMLLIAAFFLLSNPPSLTSQQQAQVKHLEQSLLAPCCYSQSIAQHMSGAAAQMREEVTSMVASGMSEQEIIAHYKALYGDQILIVPDGRTGKVLYALPVLIFLVAIGALSLVFRRMLPGKENSTAVTGALNLCSPRDTFREQIERETRDAF